MTARANKVRGEATLELSGVAHRLVPSYQNLVAVEESTGLGLLSLARGFASGEVSAANVARMVACVSEPKLTEIEVGEAMMQGQMMSIVEAAGQFILNAITGGDEGKVKAGAKGMKR